MKDYIPFIVSGLIVILLWATTLWFVSHAVSGDQTIANIKLNAFAEMGDSFGVINALFSGLAFAGIIGTIILQKKELSLQRTELELTRVELNKSAIAQNESQKALKIQVSLMAKQAVLQGLVYELNNYQSKIDSEYTTDAERGDALRNKKVLGKQIQINVRNLEKKEKSLR